MTGRLRALPFGDERPWDTWTPSLGVRTHFLLCVNSPLFYKAHWYLATASGVPRGNIPWKASFLSRTAFVTTGVHQDVQGLSLEAPMTLRPELSTAASAMEALSINHSGSVPLPLVVVLMQTVTFFTDTSTLCWRFQVCFAYDWLLNF